MTFHYSKYPLPRVDDYSDVLRRERGGHERFFSEMPFFGRIEVTQFLDLNKRLPEK